MKQLAQVFIGIGIALQILFDCGTFFLPSMASAEGVAVYPQILNTLIGFLYRCLPYLICSVSLVIASRRFTKWLKPVSLASILSVLSPLFAVAAVSLFAIPVSEFRERFWPLRPLVQLAVFFPSALIARGIMHLGRGAHAERRC